MRFCAWGISSLLSSGARRAFQITLALCSPVWFNNSGERNTLLNPPGPFVFVILCSENLLSQMPFHTTCLIYLVQLIAVENIHSQGHIFVAHSQQECGRVAAEARKEQDTPVLGSGGWRAHLWTHSKLTVWRTCSGKVWLWLSSVSTAELGGRVTMGRRTHEDAYRSGAGHRTAHQSGFLPKDKPQLSRNSGTKDIPAYIREWDLTIWSPAVQSYQLVYIFILFLYLLIWNRDIKKKMLVF